MKKISAVLLLCSTISFVSAQNSFQVIDPDNNQNIVSNGTIDLWGDPTGDIEKEFDIKNVSNSSKTVKLKRVIVSGFNFNLPDQDTIQICWNVCLSPNWIITQTAGNVNINSNSVASFSSSGIGFHSLFSPSSTPGTRVIRYTFWDVNNANDSVNITINYHITGVGTNSFSMKEFNFSNPQPNPASGFTTIRYNFPTVVKAKIKIYNAVGTLIKEINLEDQSGKIFLNTDDLSNGIYFYSLVVNDKTAGTKKLIVAQ